MTERNCGNRWLSAVLPDFDKCGLDPAVMFEGTPPSHPEAPPGTDVSAADDSRRQVTWEDLKTRLATIRELRLGLPEDSSDDAASFDADFARKIAAQHVWHDGLYHDDADHAESKRNVNPSDLVKSKHTGRNIGRQSISHDPTNRGNT